MSNHKSRNLMAQDSGDTVEFEQLRSLDATLMCPHDFGKPMLATNEILKRKEQETAISAQNDSFIHPEPSMSMVETPKTTYESYIILVPQTPKSAINNTNIEKFLQNSVWTEPVTDRTKNEIHITHLNSTSQRPMKFIIKAKLDPREPDWKNRIAAIFLSGHAWQIRDYVPNDPGQLFSKTLGIFVRFDGEQIPSDVAPWKIKKYVINKGSRHLDAQVVTSIWEDIEIAVGKLKKGK